MLKGSELPSMKALRTFVAVANNMSFSKAAIELSVTQGAVSKQIAALEQQLGQPLFERHINGLSLSGAGKRYLPKISQAIEMIQYSTSSLLQTELEQEILSVNVTPSFASLWLIPNIESFNGLNPNIRLSVKTGDGLIKNINGDSDLYIRCLPLSKHYENATLLRKEKLLLVAPASYSASKVGEPQLESLPFIPQTTRPQLWEQFKAEHEISQNSRFYGVGFEHFYMSLEAVKKRSGMALLPDFMVNRQLREKRLTNPMQLSVESGYGYYVIVPSYRLTSRKVYMFNQWLNAHLAVMGEMANRS
ncbi:LysR family transcriptional regulator [Vibrio sp. SCSIO 43137]|uniref:LysR family transcriptional regulator n=1 Tax=Vibrio sp. SCSIO 43137 TaxID=3021011 RepID=UPI002308069A|nr:LysR family transcriptional regulator [Vibrio sp. SCSIO 43137]WCE30880.1 LysR family transcriptional regulator [Vibrio sp. SCSIO 43137]